MASVRQWLQIQLIGRRVSGKNAAISKRWRLRIFRSPAADTATTLTEAGYMSRVKEDVESPSFRKLLPKCDFDVRKL